MSAQNGFFRNIIVIGASAGGIPAINKVISGLPEQMDAAVVVVIHLSKKSNARNIVTGFQRHTSLNCRVAANDMLMERGHLYLAIPDHQLMLKGGFLRVNHGPHENKYRPSIDVLFRSAAVCYGHRVIGMILTGLLEDGTSGMSAIKRTGGICIVQDPTEAQFSDMPRSVLNKISVDYQANLHEIPFIVDEILNKPLSPKLPIPIELQIEAIITEKMMSNIDELKKIGDKSDFVCPDCGGGLWAIKNDPLHRYRCFTGHVYTEKLLNDLKDENIEESIWIAIRILEEKENLLYLMASREQNDGEQDDYTIRDSYLRRMNDIKKHIRNLKSFLNRLHEDLNKSETV